MQRNWTGSCLKSDQLADIGVRNILRPQAVFDAHPEPDLLRCVTLILFPCCVADVANHIEFDYLVNHPNSIPHIQLGY